jgi:thiol-disulfide isomerase/thioredoxin
MRNRSSISIAALALALLASTLFAIQEGQDAPDFTLPSIGGRSKIHLAEYRGKVVLVDFWATWCAPCIGSLPELVGLARRFEGRPLAILSVSADGDGRALQHFLAAHPPEWPQAWDKGGRMSRDRYDIHSFPTFLVLAPRGKVVAKVQGWGPGRIPRSVQPAIEKALAAASTPEAQPTSGGGTAPLASGEGRASPNPGRILSSPLR